MIRSSIYRSVEGWTVKQTFNPEKNNFKVVFSSDFRQISTEFASPLTPAQAEEEIGKIIEFFNELAETGGGHHGR